MGFFLFSQQKPHPANCRRCQPGPRWPQAPIMLKIMEEAHKSPTSVDAALQTSPLKLLEIWGAQSIPAVCLSTTETLFFLLSACLLGLSGHRQQSSCPTRVSQPFASQPCIPEMARHINTSSVLAHWRTFCSWIKEHVKSIYIVSTSQKKKKKRFEFLFSEDRNAVGGQWACCTALDLLKIIYCREKSAVVGHCVYWMFREDHTTHKHDRTTLNDHISLSLPICRTVIVGILKVHNH